MFAPKAGDRSRQLPSERTVTAAVCVARAPTLPLGTSDIALTPSQTSPLFVCFNGLNQNSDEVATGPATTYSSASQVKRWLPAVPLSESVGLSTVVPKTAMKNRASHAIVNPNSTSAIASQASSCPLGSATHRTVGRRLFGRQHDPSQRSRVNSCEP